MNRTRTRILASFVLAGACLTGTGCGGTTIGNPITTVEDSSVSGTAASMAGKALNSSSSTSAVVALDALLDAPALSAAPYASTAPACPTFRSTSTAECAASGSTLWLKYAACSIGTSTTTLDGAEALIMSGGTATCGKFPSPGANGSLTRQYVTALSSSTPGQLTLTRASGTQEVIDHGSANLANFDNAPIGAIAGSGYGTQVTFTNGVRTGLTLGARLSTVPASFDHSVSGALTITESSGATSRTITGHLTVYHNLLKVIGTSTFNNVVHTDGCCFPTSGSVTTAFSAGANVSPTTDGAAAVGKSETLTFTGCGTATFTSHLGVTSNVTLSRCY